MRSAWICVLSLVWSACASTAPVSGDVDDTSLGLGSADEDKQHDEDSPPKAAKPVVTCFDARHGISVSVHESKPREPGDAAQPGEGPGLPAPPEGPGNGSCDPDAPQPGQPVPGRPQPPVLVLVEREDGAVACGCGVGHVEGAAGVPANLPDGAPVPGVPATPPVPVSGGQTQHTSSSGSHTVSGPGVPGAPVVTITISSGTPGEPAKIVAPPSCAELSERCYADGGEVELCEQLADCCANTPVPAPH